MEASYPLSVQVDVIAFNVCQKGLGGNPIYERDSSTPVIRT